MCYNINSIKVCTTFSLSFAKCGSDFSKRLHLNKTLMQYVALKQILGEQF